MPLAAETRDLRHAFRAGVFAGGPVRNCRDFHTERSEDCAFWPPDRSELFGGGEQRATFSPRCDRQGLEKGPTARFVLVTGRVDHFKAGGPTGHRGGIRGRPASAITKDPRLPNVFDGLSGAGKKTYLALRRSGRS